jgi:ribonuclease D
MNISYIDNKSNLESLFNTLNNSKQISFDTEFIRVTTYSPKIGLLQLKAQGQIYLIDPLSISYTNFEKIIDVLCNGDFELICHGSIEDLEIIRNIRLYGFYFVGNSKLSDVELNSQKNVLPKNIFDTQLASKFLFADEKLGLAPLLDALLGVKLEKTETTTDWLARPLTDAQVEYAALDVEYLEQLKEKLEIEFTKKPLIYEYFKEEMKAFVRASSFDKDVDDIYMNFRRVGTIKPDRLKLFYALCKLRHEICIEQNCAPSYFLKNESMIALVRNNPFEISQYINYGVHYTVVKKYGKLIRTTLIEASDKNQEVKLPYEFVFHDDRLKRLVPKLKSYLETKQKELGISKDLLSTRKLMEKFFYYHIYDQSIEEPLLQTGWRREVLGDLSGFLKHS